jgi:hypothetical protein
MTKRIHAVMHATAQHTLEQVDSATAATLSEMSTTEAEPQLAPVAQDALVTFIVGTDGNDILFGRHERQYDSGPWRPMPG